MEGPRDDLTVLPVPRCGGYVAAMLGVSGLLAISGYWLAFSSYRDFDDEGLFLQGVRFALDDTILYDELVVPFGPAYYMESGLVHGLLSLPPTTDGIRWHLLSLWLATSGVAATVVFALTRRMLLCSLALIYSLNVDPVAGSQKALTVVLVIPLACGQMLLSRDALCFEDFIERLRELWVGIIHHIS